MAHGLSPEASSDVVLDTTHSDAHNQTIQGFRGPDLHLLITARLASLEQELREAAARLQDVMHPTGDVDISDFDSEADSDNEELPLSMLTRRDPRLFAMDNISRCHRNFVDVAFQGTLPSPNVDLKEGCDNKGKEKVQVSENKKRRLSSDEDYGRRLGWVPFPPDYRIQSWPLRENTSRKYFTGDPSGSWQVRREDDSVHLPTDSNDSN